MEPRLRRQLDRVGHRVHQVRRERASAVVWVVFAAIGVLLLLLRPDLGAAMLVAALALLATACVIGIRGAISRGGRDPLAAARLVESRHPELDSALLAAAELEPDLPRGRFGFLATRLVDQVLRQSRRQHWEESVAGPRLVRARAMHGVAAIAFACAAAAIWSLSPVAPSVTKETGPAAAGPTRTSTEVVVVPGDADVERGRSVLVSARFAPDLVPLEATLVHHADGAEPLRVPMTRSLDDPLFGVRLSSVGSDLSYRIEWRDEASRWFRLTVFEHPELAQSDVHLRYPEYAGLEDRVVERTRRVTAPEGTGLTLVCRLNKAVATATLVDEATKEELSLVPDPDEPLAYRATFVLTESRRLGLALVDDAGRGNKTRTEFVFKATENRRPELRLTSAGDARVTPIEEMTLGAKLTDDFGLRRIGVGYRLGGGEPTDVVLSDASAKTAEVEHTIEFEELGAEPAQLLSYHLWTEDLGSDGGVRRTTSDLFFAEVRPFEEIFRQAEQPPGGAEAGGQEGGEQGGQEGGQGQQAADLAQLQRDVILATWKLMQRDESDEGSLVDDAEVVRDAQSDARDQLDTLAMVAAMGGGEASLDIIGEIGGHMDRAIEELERAIEDESVEPLSDALAAEQSAAQTLLELSEHEYAVARANQQQQGSQNSRANARGGPSQAQMQELELRNAENRYETQRQAQSAPSLDAEAARETREARNRLEELSRRQQDLNDRLRELGSEIEAAETEEEREELRRRLKRLQEAQQEILRDTDELLQDMKESASGERLAEQIDDLDEAREGVRRAMEALDDERLAEAQTEGARAERQMEEVGDELRDAAGEQFQERMEDMRREARELAAEEVRLAERLRGEDESERPTLDGSSERDALEEAFRRQESDLSDLLEEVEETVRDAEETEPLLAEELFDTLNEARQSGVGEALELTREMVEQGFPRGAQASEEIAREGLEELARGIEDAAEEVLGTGVETLERASDELDRLARELDSELADARGERTPSEPREGRGERGQGQPGEDTPRDGEPTPGDQPGQQPREQPGQQPGEQPGQQPGEQPGQQPGQQPGDQPGERGPRQPRPALDGPDPSRPESAGGRAGGGGRIAEDVAPLTGDDYRDWYERLRDVEDLLEDPELSAEAARIRSRARQVREDFKRHSKEPNWDLVDEMIAGPLAELAERVSDEVRRRRADDATVPIDRDPVPPEFEEEVRRYYERLGRGK